VSCRTENGKQSIVELPGAWNPGWWPQIMRALDFPQTTGRYVITFTSTSRCHACRNSEHITIARVKRMQNYL
jgi:hypothetical protein